MEEADRLERRHMRSGSKQSAYSARDKGGLQYDKVGVQHSQGSFNDRMRRIQQEQFGKGLASSRLSRNKSPLMHSKQGSQASSYMASKKTVEINPYHPVILKLSEKIKENAEDDDAKDFSLMLYDSALVSAGFDIDDQQNFQKRMLKGILNGLGVDEEAKPEEPEDEPDEEEAKDEEAKDEEKKEEL